MRFHQDSIQFRNLAEFEQFTRLLGHDIKMLHHRISKIKLARDVFNENNALLSRAGTTVDTELFRKLSSFTTSAKSARFEIHIEKTPEIAAKLNNIIRSTAVAQIYNARILPKVGRNLFKRREEQLLDVVRHVFKNSQLTYAYFSENCVQLYKNEEFKGFQPAVFESIVKGFLSLGTELSHEHETTEEYLQELFICHFIVTLVRLDSETRLSPEARKDDIEQFYARYLLELEQMLHLSPAIIRTCQAILTDENLLQAESLFDEPALHIYKNVSLITHFYNVMAENDFENVTVNSVIAGIYTRCHQNQLDGETLEKLSTWLKKPSIFRMHKAIKTLESRCNRGPNGSSNAMFYPKHGSGVPTMFICTQNDHLCPHISTAFRRINVARNVENLPAGTYTKCQLLTDGLHKYYQHDLGNIKREQNKLA